MRIFTICFLSCVQLLSLRGLSQEISIPLKTSRGKVATVQQSGTRLIFSFSFDQMKINNSMAKTGDAFTELTLDDCFIYGEIGSPKLPSYSKLIQIPVGSTPVVRVGGGIAQDIVLSEYDVTTKIAPVQPSLRKDQDESDLPFELDSKVYATDGYLLSDIATVKILGTMRGVSIAQVVITPVNYNPARGVLQVYNDLNVEVDYNQPTKDAQDLMLRTASPYFDATYGQLANKLDRTSGTDYPAHPDLTKYPVRMVIVSHRMFEATLQPFIEWKKLKGFKVETYYTDVIGTTAAAIQAKLHSLYNAATPSNPAPTFIVLVGDVAQVPASATGSSSAKMTDLYYASVDGDMFPEMYYGRMSASTTTQLQNIINKILYYEKYQFADPTYLNKTTLIAGVDATWNARVGQSTIKYATANYFNPVQGYTSVFEYGVSSDPNNPSANSGYSGCYASDRIAVGFINYTAHCNETSWGDPSLTATTLNGITNQNKYPLAVGNCCLSAEFGTSECIGETWIRLANKGAVTYIGSSPSSYWFEDVYWAVGAFPGITNYPSSPTFANSTLGAYDAPHHSNYVSAGGIVAAGNLAVTAANTSSYSVHSTPLYYWQAYNVLGDPSLVPYYTEGDDLNISHNADILINATSFTVGAPNGSYVALSKNGELLGAALVTAGNTVDVNITPVTPSGNVQLVVTKPQAKPKIVTLPVSVPSTAYITASNITVNDANHQADFGETFSINATLNNVGAVAGNNLLGSITGSDRYFTKVNAGPTTISNIAAGASINLTNAFSFALADSVPDQHVGKFDMVITNGANTWTSKMNITANSPVLKVVDLKVKNDANSNGIFNVGEVAEMHIRLANHGHSAAGAVVVKLTVSNPSVTITNPAVTISVPAGDTVNAVFNIASAASIVEGTDVIFRASGAQGGYSCADSVVVTVGNKPVIYVGAGTAAPDNYPFSNYYKSGRTQVLYLKSELSSIPRKITHIGYNFTSIGTVAKFVNLTIRVKEVSESALGTSYIDMTGATVVFTSASYTMPTVAGWHDFDIADYVYSGTANLLVEVSFGLNADWTSTRYKVSSSETGFTSVVYGRSDTQAMPSYYGNAKIRPNLKVVFDPAPLVTYTINATAGTNGSILPVGVATVYNGATPTYTITANANYMIEALKVDGVAVAAAAGLSSYNYTFAPVAANRTISATFKLKTYTITATAGAKGSILPVGTAIVNHGETPTYTITPNTNYVIDALKVDGVAVVAAAGLSYYSYTFAPVAANRTISATFKLKTYTITATAGANGSISPVGTATVNHGDTPTYTITPSTNYVIDVLKVDGVDIATAAGLSSYSYTFTPVAANRTISVTFKFKTYTITATAGANGSISPVGTATVNHGATPTYTIAPSTNYVIDALKVDGVAVAAAAGLSSYSYTFAPVAANRTISVTFRLKTYTITATAGAKGSILPVGINTVNHGETPTYTITPNTNYVIDALKVDGVAVAAAAGLSYYSYTFAPVVANRTIDATFRDAVSPALSISPLNQAVTSGAGTTSFAVANAGGGSMAWTASVAAADTWLTITSGASGTNAGSIACAFTPNNGAERVGTITVTAMGVAGSPATITVTQAAKTYTVNATAGVNGSITPAGTVTVNHGATPTYTITPNTNYVIDALRVDGIAIVEATGLSSYSYTFAPVAANRTISATFRLKTYTITATAGANGSISPVGIATVNHGATPTYTITPNTNYVIDALNVDGIAIVDAAGLSSYNYTFAPVAANRTISATFRLKTYTITATAGANGSITPEGATTVNHGAIPSYTANANVGFVIDALKVDGVDIEVAAGLSSYSYTFAPVAANRTISATFRLKTYTITATAGANGSITPEGATTVNHGAMPSYTANANVGFVIDALKVDGVDIEVAAGLSSYSYTFAPVAANRTIDATFRVASTPALSINPLNQDVTSGAGTSSFSVANAGGGSMAWTASVVAADTWLTITSGASGTNMGSIACAFTPNNGAERVGTITVTAAGAVGSPATITVTQAAKTYTITATAGANGSITPEGATTVNHGAMPSYTANANAGFVIDALKVDGVDIEVAAGLSSYSYTFAPVAANRTISATFRLKTYTITATAGENGSITPAGTATVNHGAMPSYTATANAGYVIDALKVDGVDIDVAAGLSSYSYTFAPVAANRTISATFRLKTYTITATAGENGSITPAGTATVNHGAMPSYTATANVGYVIDVLKVDGVDIEVAAGLSSYSYTFAPVAANRTISATFRLKTYTITATAGENGSITPAGTATVNHGAMPSYTANANAGYVIDVLKVDGVDIEVAAGLSSYSYTFAPVAANRTISATFRLKTYTITATAGANGSIAPAGTATVNHGDTPAYSIVANENYLIDALKVDGVDIEVAAGLSSYSYTFAPVAANRTISVTFRLKTYTIIATAGENGSITPAGTVTVNHGDTPAYSIVANENYLIDALKVDGVDIEVAAGLSSYSYTFAPVAANRTISATFRLKTYIITATAGANGSITPEGATTVNHGAMPSYTANANAGYVIDVLKVDGVDIEVAAGLSSYSYTFAPVAANRTISVTFRLKTYTITATAGANGSIAPAGTATVNHGDTPAYSIVANENYLIDALKVDGVDIEVAAGLSSYSYTFAPVAANRTISVTFRLKTYTIIATTGENGSITPAGTVTVNHGDTPAYSIVANENYLIDALKVDGVDIEVAAGLSSYSYTFAPVAANRTISATFRLKTYTITATAGENGAISPSGQVSVQHGVSVDFVATSATDFLIDTLWVDGVAIADAHRQSTYTYMFANVATNHTIAVRFRNFTGIDSPSPIGFKLYPNPVSSLLTIESQQGIEEVQVFDATGRIICSEQGGTTKLQLNAGNWSSGVYSIRISTRFGFSTHRVVKQ